MEINILNQRKERRFYAILLVASIIPFAFVYCNRVFTDVVGWQVYNFERAREDGLFIYRDFFSYVPPAFHLEVAFTQGFLFDGSFLGVRMWGIAVRAIVFLLEYYILTRWFKPKYVWICCVLGCVLFYTASYDAFGDYAQGTIFFMLLSLYFACVASDNWGNRKKTICCLILSGMAASMCMLYKQSWGIVLFAAYFAMLFVFWWYKKEKQWVECFLYALLGYSVPMIICCAIMYSQGALSAFFEQIFLVSVNSKGVDSESLVPKLFSANFSLQYVVISATLLGVIVVGKVATEVNSKLLKKAFWVGVGIAIYLFWNYYGENFRDLYIVSSERGYIFWVIIAGFIAVLLGMWYRYGNRRNELDANKIEIYQNSVFGCCFFLAYFVVSVVEIDGVKEYYSASGFSTLTKLLYFLAFYIALLTVIDMFVTFLLRKEHRYPIGVFFTLVCAMVGYLSTAVGSGTGAITSVSNVIGAPIAFCILSDIIPKKKIFVLSGICLGCCLCFLTMTQKITTPYSWWGWTSEPISDATNYEFESERLQGFKVSKKTKVFIDQITRLVEENSEEEDFVFTFPYSKIYNILSGRLSAPTFVGVYFFDVCPDQYALSDLEILKENYPKIIVWKDVGENCWTTHEALFRGGNRLGQRDIQEWYNQVVKESYILIGKVGSTSIYRLDDGSPINYTYFATDEDFKSIETEVEDADPKFHLLMTSLFYLGLSEKHQKTISMVIIAVLALMLLLVSRYLEEFWKVLLLLTLVIGCCFRNYFVYFFLFIIPFILYCTESGFRGKARNIVYGLLMMGIIVPAFWGWSSADEIATKISIASYLSCLVILLLEAFVCAIHQWRKKIAALGKNDVRDDGSLKKWLICAIAVLIFCGAGAPRYVAARADVKNLERLSEFCDKVTVMTVQNMNTEYRTFLEEDQLVKLGSDGLLYRELVEAFNVTYPNCFSSKLLIPKGTLKDLDEENVYIRISGSKVTVWVQAEEDQIGNSGWAEVSAFTDSVFLVKNEN